MTQVCRRPVLSALLVATLVLLAVAWLRGAEYDEQYTLFLTGQVMRPQWPREVIAAGDVRALQAAQLRFAGIAHDLRAMDVHPPLYFWSIAAWRGVAGDTLFAARLFSVLCSVATLCLVAMLAMRAALPAAAAVLFTVGCYGFSYTGAIARGFALAQLLSVAGVAASLVAARTATMLPALAGGVLLGAATFTNYIAGFVAAAALLWLATLPARWKQALAAAAGFAAWLPADLWFFLAQRHGRGGQFATFDLVNAVMRLGRYAAASVFGGLPLYADGTVRTVVAGTLATLLIGLAVRVVLCWRQIATPQVRRLLRMAALAPPCGLLLLGLAFDNTPIELRYLAFAMPFVGLLLAAVLPARWAAVVLAVQAVALVGLMTRPETMQPARATAAAVALLVRDGVVLLPHGNDGVGIVGAFAIEAPPPTRLLVVAADATPAEIRQRVRAHHRIVLALLGQDADSRATLPAMRAAFDHRCWRLADQAADTLAFERVCDGD